MATFRYIVRSVDEAVAFYTDLLGFSVKQQFGPAMAIVARDDVTLWLAGPEASASRPMPDGRKPEPGGWNRMVIEVPDLPAAVSKFREQGATFRNDIVTGPGGRQILCEDPSGNPIELFQAASTGDQ
jgi:catechol 2,3-dioxygenase-like lactoylglutathione lyase family enzyme